MHESRVHDTSLPLQSPCPGWRASKTVRAAKGEDSVEECV